MHEAGWLDPVNDLPAPVPRKCAQTFKIMLLRGTSRTARDILLRLLQQGHALIVQGPAAPPPVGSKNTRNSQPIVRRGRRKARRGGGAVLAGDARDSSGGTEGRRGGAAPWRGSRGSSRAPSWWRSKPR